MYTLEESMKIMNSKHQNERCILWEVYDNEHEWIFAYGDYIKEGYILTKVFSLFDKQTGKETIVYPPKIDEYDLESLKVVYARKITIDEAIAVIHEFYFNCNPSFATKIVAIYEDDDNFYFLLENEIFRYKKYVLVEKGSGYGAHRDLSDSEVNFIRPSRLKKCK